MTAPGYDRIAEAIEDCLAAADLDVVVSRSHLRLLPTEGLLALARVLDKAGLIDWAAFNDQPNGGSG